MTLPFPFTWTRKDADPGGIEINLTGKEWTQSGGYWWGSFQSLGQSQPLDPSTGTFDSQLAAGSSGNSKAISPRGIVLFPQGSSDPADIIAAVLSPNYVSQGGEIIPTGFIDDGLTAGEGQYAVSLTHEPISDFYSYFSGLDDLGLFYESFLVDSTLYAIAVSEIYANGGVPISITYQFQTASSSAHDDFSGDGASTTFALTTTPALSLTGVTVDGIADLLAYLSGNNMVLSSAASAGAAISCDYTYAVTSEQTDVFLPPTNGANVTSFDLSHVPLEGTISVSGFGTQTVGDPPIDLMPLVDGQTVRFAMQIPDDSPVYAEYTYNQSTGELFSMTGLTITEWNLTTSVSAQLVIPFEEPFDATPVSQFLPALGTVSSAGGSHWQDGWSHQRWGFLHYDPNLNAYTVVAPDGMHCCPRVDGSLGTTYTTKAWNTEDVSTDWALVGNASPLVMGAANSDLPRRTAPYMGIGAVSRYALQGSWGSIGPNMVTSTQVDVTGDTAFPIRFFRRDGNNVWQMVAALDATQLVADNASENPLYIPGSGIIHREGDGGYATGRRGFSPSNSFWPATHDASAWIIGCGWCEAEWGRDVSSLSLSDFPNYPVGTTDAGYTLNSVDMAGEVISQLTIKCDPTDEESSYANPDSAVNYAMAHSGDFLPNFPIETAYLATDFFGYLEDYGFCYFYYLFSRVDGPAKSPKLQMPGIPALADGEPRYTPMGTDYGPYGRIAGPEDNATSQSIAGDNNDNFYVTLSIPYWVRIMDAPRVVNTEEVTGVFNTGPIGGSGGDYNELLFRCQGYLGAPIISRVRDQYVNGRDAGVYPVLTGYRDSGSDRPDGYVECHPQTGFSTPYQLTYDYQMAYVTPKGHTNDQGDFVYDPQNFDNLSVPWAQTIPNRSTALLRRTYDVGADGATFYSNPPGGYTDFAPYRGAAVYDVVGDNRRRYDVNARTFMFKFNSNDRVLTEVWRQDISQLGKVSPDYPKGGGEYEPALTISKFAKVHFTRPCGRYVFLLRNLILTVATGNPSPYDTAEVEYLGLEVWTNAGPTETLAKKFTVKLPNPPTPFTYADYHGALIDLQMHEGVDSSGREWAFVTGNLGNQHYWFKIQFNSDDMIDPVVISNNGTSNSPYAPTPFNTQGMAESSSVYLWTEDDGSLNTRNGV